MSSALVVNVPFRSGFAQKPIGQKLSAGQLLADSYTYRLVVIKVKTISQKL